MMNYNEIIEFYAISGTTMIDKQLCLRYSPVQYIPRNMHTVFALLCFGVVIHWLIFPYPSGLLHWHCGNLKIAPVPAKQPWWIWINTSCEFIMNDCIATTKQSTTKPCAYFLGYTVVLQQSNIALTSILTILVLFCSSLHWKIPTLGTCHCVQITEWVIKECSGGNKQ